MATSSRAGAGPAAGATTGEKTPAQLYSLVFGAILLLVGILGFFVDSSFGTGDDVNGDDLIIFEVNGWHNIVHILSGVVGLAMAKRNDTARLFALGFGGVYLLVTILGFITGEPLLGLLALNTADNFLHLLIAAAGIAAGLASPAGDARDTRLR